MSIVEDTFDLSCVGNPAPLGNGVVSDKVLLECVAKGDQGALRALMRRHQSRIYRFVLRFIRDRGIAEDIVSDTFVAVWRQAPDFENRSSVATWLLAIARYKALSARERLAAPHEPLDEVAATLVDPGCGPDAAIERRDVARVLRQCLAALPTEQAMLIDLVYFREKTVREAAVIAGVSENTVKSRMFLGRKKLAVLLNAADVESESVTLVPNLDTCRPTACDHFQSEKMAGAGESQSRR
jgi:RNA polymerase sigma-70 factor (ECF subfamily)